MGGPIYHQRLDLLYLYRPFTFEGSRKTRRSTATKCQCINRVLDVDGLLVIVQIIVETLVGLILGILGASLNAPPLKEITWASEMRKQYVMLPSPVCPSQFSVAKLMKWTLAWDLRTSSIAEGTSYINLGYLAKRRHSKINFYDYIFSQWSWAATSPLTSHHRMLYNSPNISPGWSTYPSSTLVIIIHWSWCHETNTRVQWVQKMSV